jgi:predicted 3-demethylubiquinone-9 3-methyltransferase (glyoxalase superfamily)
MFQGNKAEEAIDFYMKLIPNSNVEEIRRYGDTNPDFSEQIMIATVCIGGQRVLFSDSPIKHNFDFTPSFSLFVECESDEEIQSIASALEKGGRVLMPLGSYGFSDQFAWIEDRFGVSFQLNVW